MKTCIKCRIEKEYIKFYVYKNNKDGYRNICIECFKKDKAEYQKNNKEKAYLYTSQYLKRNPEINNQNCKKYRKKRYNNDPIFRLKDKRTEEVIGCSI
jgi:hypothetical protein